MGCSAFSDIHLNGVVLPGTVLLDRDKVRCKPPHDPTSRKDASHLESSGLDLHAVVVECRKSTSLKDLTPGSSEDLVMGGDGHRLPQGVHTALGGG